MENQIKNYFDYLMYIGVTSESTSSVIIQLLKSKYKKFNSNSIDDLLISLSCNYIKSLTQEQLELKGKNIYEQFLKNKLKASLKQLKKVLNIKYHFLKRQKKKYFNIWRLESINLATHKSESFSKNTVKKSSYSNLSLSINNFLDRINYYNDRKRKIMESLNDIKENNITSNCTFSPNIKRKSKKNIKIFEKINEKRRNYNKNLYNFLYDDYKIKNIELEELSKKIYDERGVTFSPKLNSDSKYNNKIKDNFFERNQKMIDKKQSLLSVFTKNNKNKKPSISSHKHLKKSFSNYK